MVGSDTADIDFLSVRGCTRCKTSTVLQCKAVWRPASVESNLHDVMSHCSLRTEAVGRGTYTVLQLSTKRIILLAWRITWRITTCCLNVHRKGSASKCPCREAESSAVRPSWHCRSRSSVSGVISFFGNKKQSTRAKRSRFVINICISTAFQTDLISPFYDITRITP